VTVCARERPRGGGMPLPAKRAVLIDIESVTECHDKAEQDVLLEL